MLIVALPFVVSHRARANNVEVAVSGPNSMLAASVLKRREWSHASTFSVNGN
jgi:hypothetical protein